MLIAGNLYVESIRACNLLLALPFQQRQAVYLKQDPEPLESISYDQLRDPQLAGLTDRAFDMAGRRHVPQQAVGPGVRVHGARLIRNKLAGEHAIAGAVITCNYTHAVQNALEESV
jgi:hypothetical protein